MTRTYYDADGDKYQALTAHDAADQVYGSGNHDGQSMWSVDADGWIQHVLGSGAADILVDIDDTPFGPKRVALAKSSYISGKRLASVRASLRRRGLDPASARAGDSGPGCYLHTILDRAQMRGERSAVEAAIMETLDWDDPRSPVHVCTGPNCCCK